MDSPRTSRAGSRSRRKIFSCPVCDEVFIDEESLRRHELTHQNPEAGGEEGGAGTPPSGESEPPPAPEPAPAAEDEGSAVQEAPAAPAPRARPLSSVRRQAAQAAAAQEAAPAQVEPEANFLPPTDSIEMPVDPDATVRVQHPHLGPMGWEGEAKKGGGLGPLWRFIEDFSEWFVRGTTKTASTVGFSVLSGVGLALRALLILAMAAACLYAGTWVGRLYGHRGDEVPPPPPTRTVTNSGELNQQAVTDLVVSFYESINEKNYQDAYDALSPEWQREMTLDQFRNGYAKTENARCAVKAVRSLKGGRYQVDIGLEVTESGKKHFYKGDYTAISTSKGWKLDQGNIR
ncbi:MAG: C2H2-type zinc finger protein [Candidatus Eremiobacteraeota bacterium]|nr:C2H2-type zinc finger protein [Candidatus Eremiobacteraeota bacterium]MCW5867414.1 C2H2-type zinc finger protein [Candidatus Eremiobacteraeota bacterium]